VKGLRVAILLFFFFVYGSCLSGGTIYVDASGPNDPGTGAYADPYRRIQDAIDDSNDGDVIEIRPGLYTGAGNFNLDPNGRGVTIRSIDPNNQGCVSGTIIDPNGAGRGFYFHSGEDANCVVSGLTIQKGFAVGQSGGAVVCTNGSVTIENCIIKNNSAAWYGGAIFLNGGTVSITNCKLIGSLAQDGGL
jgi:hypothetical protein